MMLISIAVEYYVDENGDHMPILTDAEERQLWSQRESAETVPDMISRVARRIVESAGRVPRFGGLREEYPEADDGLVDVTCVAPSEDDVGEEVACESPMEDCECEAPSEEDIVHVMRASTTENITLAGSSGTTSFTTGAYPNGTTGGTYMYANGAGETYYAAPPRPSVQLSSSNEFLRINLQDVTDRGIHLTLNNGTVIRINDVEDLLNRLMVFMSANNIPFTSEPPCQPAVEST